VRALSRLGQILRMLARILAALVLLAMALFCAFGFLASFEPGNGLIWKVGYGALACGFLVGAVAFLRGAGHDSERNRIFHRRATNRPDGHAVKTLTEERN